MERPNRLRMYGVLAVALPALSIMTGVACGATLYDQIGGESRLRAAVGQFVTVMEADDRINFTFAETDLNKFSQLLYEQICELTQGPCHYTGRDMHEAHAKLNITNAQFNALAEDFYIAMERAGIPYRVQNRVIALLAPMQKDIVKPGFVAPGTQAPPSGVR